jgi:hypothetical protein
VQVTGDIARRTPEGLYENAANDTARACSASYV